jgi:hypothetical protein
MNQTTRTTLYAGKFLALVKVGHWEFADRVNATGAAIIIAVTTEQKVLLVEQYRTPVHARTIELPAGIIGDEPGCNSPAKCSCKSRIEAGGTGPIPTSAFSPFVGICEENGENKAGFSESCGLGTASTARPASKAVV